MRFDWYAATVPAGPDEVWGTVLAHHRMPAKLKPMRPMHGYERGALLEGPEGVLMRGLWGGSNGDDVHIWATGPDAVGLADLVRREWPEHRLTRGDVCEDYTGPDAWDRLTGIVLRTADEFGIKVMHHGDFHRQEDGRSFYTGGQQAVARVVTYEKGRQLREDPDWVRVELRVKPKGGEARKLASLAGPSDLWGAARWTKVLGERLGIPELERIRLGSIRRVADDERAYRALLHQYGPLMTRQAARAGGWGAFGEQIGLDLAPGCGAAPHGGHGS